MPTILRFVGLRVVIYPGDHRPAHVYVVGGGSEAVFKLHWPNGPPELRENYGFSARALNRIAAALTANLTDACRDWETIHGQT